MKRPYALLLSALFALASFAQGPVQVIHLAGTVDVPVSAKKLLTIAVSELDPQGRISIDGREIKVRVAADVDPTAVIEALNVAAGDELTLVRVTGTHAKTVDALGTPAPVLIDTGHPEADEAALRAAKQAWRDSDPAAHDAYVRSLRQQQPTPHAE